MKPKQSDQAELTYLSPGDASSRLGVSLRTMGRLADRGDVRAVTLPSGHRRYALEDIEALAGGHAGR